MKLIIMLKEEAVGRFLKSLIIINFQLIKKGVQEFLKIHWKRAALEHQINTK